MSHVSSPPLVVDQAGDDGEQHQGEHDGQRHHRPVTAAAGVATLGVRAVVDVDRAVHRHVTEAVNTSGGR